MSARDIEGENLLDLRVGNIRIIAEVLQFFLDEGGDSNRYIISAPLPETARARWPMEASSDSRSNKRIAADLFRERRCEKHRKSVLATRLSLTDCAEGLGSRQFRRGARK